MECFIYATRNDSSFSGLFIVLQWFRRRQYLHF
nr:MAG TPA: hypothetical protein [Bacteriophage sp.]